MRLKNKIKLSSTLWLILSIGLYASDANIALTNQVIKDTPSKTIKKNVVNGEVVMELNYAEVIVRLKGKINPSDAFDTFKQKNKIQFNEIEMTRSFPIVTKENTINKSDRPHIMVLKSTKLSKKELFELAEDIEGAEHVELSQPIQINSIFPNDTRFDELWGIHNNGTNGNVADADIDAPEAWDIEKGSHNIVVGVIDTGVDYTHPDLVNNIWINPGEIPNNGIDDDNNGYVDDIHGIDTINHDSDPMDDNSHGTHCSGTIGAEGNNSKGVVGVNWTTSIAACKFLNADGSGDTAGAIECVNYFNMMKSDYGIDVKVTSNSWGGGGFSQELKDAIDTSGNLDIIFAAAAGNSNEDNDVSPQYPASYDSENIIAVAATDSSDNKASFSSYGLTSVDLAAPGVDILSTIPSAELGEVCQPNDNQIFFNESFETGVTNWDMFTMDTSLPFIGNPSDIATEHWALDNSDAHIGSNSMNESLNGDYNNNRLQQAVLQSGKIADMSTLPDDTIVCASISIKGEIEGNWDYLYVYVSKDDGVTWDKIYTTSNTYVDWSTISVQLPSEYFVSNLRVALVRSNDSIVTKDGYKIDDIKITTGTMGDGEGTYAKYSGTSMATPHVAGAVALLAAKDPSKNASQLKQTILDTVDVLGSLNSYVATSGRLNLYNMLMESPQPVPKNISYIRGASQPWGSTKPEEAMDKAFGVGTWDDLRMADGCSPFNPLSQQEFIYLEGSATTANELNTYLNTCRAEIENFVSNGGKLLINSAPNEGTDIDLGFGNIILSYPDAFTANVTAYDNTHPIFNGPYTPIGTDYSGNWFAHAIISGADIEPIIVGATGETTEGDTILGEMSYGAGHVLFGGMTTTEWHSVLGAAAATLLDRLGINSSTKIFSSSSKDNIGIRDIESDNLLANILNYTANIALEGDINFDDLPTPDNGGTIVPNNYKDLTWSTSWYYLDGNNNDYNPSGYQNGMVSAPHIAFNAYEDDVTISDNTTFDFTSAYITAAWNNDLNVTLTAFKNGVEQYQHSVFVNPYTPTKVVLNWSNIDEIQFHSEGGTNAELVITQELAEEGKAHGMISNAIYTNDNKILGAGAHFVLDNVVINGEQTAPTKEARRNDLDGDGFSDLIVQNISTIEVEAYWGQNGVLPPSSSLKTLDSDSDIVDMADMNGDGSMDIIVLNNNTMELYALLGDNRYVQSKLLTTLAIGAKVVESTDINGDGYDDIIIRENDDIIALLGSQTADVTAHFLVTISADTFVKGTGDINGDGFGDIIVENMSNYNVAVLAGSASANITWLPLATFNIDTEILKTSVDINGDGYDDILFLNTLNTRLNILVGNPTGTNLLWEFLTYLGTEIQVKGTGDFDNDGRDDILLRHKNNGNITMLWGEVGGVTWNWLLPLPPALHTIIDISDINGDGYADMILRNQDNGAVNSYQGNGSRGVTWQYLTPLSQDFDIIVQ
jgi:subtilisin family serine protease